MGMDNIFMHDAVPTWSGFLYQGRIAVYLAVRKINELREAGNESEIKKYALEMEKCEDIAVVYMDGNNKKYHSIHQVKNEKSIYIHTSEDVEDIQFVNSPQDNQDILYSMSSGQLSAVALSFLLCMNQAYGAHKACSILLIDDPVQTIDDVNMVGLVDILRYGFGDRQIFISTHEQSFEWFLRYRYSKAGKNVKIFNMKDIMLQEE